MLDKHLELRRRTEAFSFRILRLVKEVPRGSQAQVIAKQLSRSATSVAANYRAVGCCRTKPEFINKLRVVLEEADETIYWIRCIREAEMMPAESVELLSDEAKQLAKIFAASLRTATRKSASQANPDDQMTR